MSPRRAACRRPSWRSPKAVSGGPARAAAEVPGRFVEERAEEREDREREERSQNRADEGGNRAMHEKIRVALGGAQQLAGDAPLGEIDLRLPAETLFD